MKIFSVDQIRKLDSFTIENEPIASIDLMERASEAFVTWFIQEFDTEKSILVCCGTGNNGGDGLSVSRLLTAKGYNVSVLVIGDVDRASDDFVINFKRLPFEASHYAENQTLPEKDIIIDAIFGSGLTRPVEGQYGELIQAVNRSKSQVVSIDIPSGLFADRVTSSSTIVKADHTVSFQLPKLVFMLPMAYEFVGEWYVVDIGLSMFFIEKEATPLYYTDSVTQLVKQPSKFDHKGSNGHALLMAGSLGKMGAAVLASQACLRAGSGLMTIHVPGGGNNILQSTVPEAMTLPDIHNDMISECKEVSQYSAIGVGPGIGKDRLTVTALEELLNKRSTTLVLDADALNIVSENRQLLELIPENAILTPHPKEFERLIGQRWKDDFEKIELQQRWAKQLHAIIVLKGAHSTIALPDGTIHFNSTGNSGMAKGGSGDVLTGIITSLLAQKYDPHEAALLGVFLHGLAGDIAASKKGNIAMTSSDIIETIPRAYNQILSNC